MAKGYFIARVIVNDPEQYAVYAKMAGEAMKLYGARPLARGGRVAALEGDARPRNVILEFDSFERAVAYYHSPEYQAAKKERENAGIADMIVVEGVE